MLNLRKTLAPCLLLLASTLHAQSATETDPVKADPKHFHVEYEDEHVRVVRMVLPPGETTPACSFMEHTTVVVRASRIVITLADGGVSESLPETGAAMHRPADTLSMRNIGNVTLETVTTELKDGHNAQKHFPIVPPDRPIVRTPQMQPPSTSKSAKETAEELAKNPNQKVEMPKDFTVPDAPPQPQPPARAKAETKNAASVLDRPTVITAPIPGAKALRVNNTTLTFYEQGSGATVVFVHGLLEDLRSWSHAVDTLSASYHTVTYSRRYHYPNPSTGKEEDYTYQQNADDLAEFIRQLGVGPVHLVAHSYGGVTAGLVTMQHPELVKSLVLMEPGFEELLPATRADAAKYSRLEIMGIVKRAFGKQKVPEHGLQVYYDWTRSSGAWDSLTLEQQQRLRDDQSALADYSHVSESPNVSCTALAAIKAPVLAVSGDHSSPNMRLITDRIAECVPGAKRLTVPNAGHAMQADNPDVFEQGVMEFLQRVGR